MTRLTTRMELTDVMLTEVNGGFGWNDFWETVTEDLDDNEDFFEDFEED